jgi:hypothetical protein
MYCNNGGAEIELYLRDEDFGSDDNAMLEYTVAVEVIDEEHRTIY